MKRSAPLKEQQNLSTGNIEGAEALVLNHRLKAEQGGIKRPGALEIAHVERSLEHAPDLRHP